EKFLKNLLDPFLIIFLMHLEEFTIDEWLKREISRQTLKFLLNNIGIFHEKVIGSVPGRERLEVGGVVDVINKEKKIAAEIKNKFNTMKGDKKKNLRDDLYRWRQSNTDFTVYYVEILSKSKKQKVNWKPKGCDTPDDDKIIRINGKDFYSLVTGNPNAIYLLYKKVKEILPDCIEMIAEHLKSSYLNLFGDLQEMLKDTNAEEDILDKIAMKSFQIE
ncbi:MAG: Eco47II family restriction endonuclease, partial [Methanobacteriota archaeon]